MDFEDFESGLLPMKRGRVIKTLSDSTIRGVIDAIVELITNSDDSYLRLEQSGKEASGRIDIHLTRLKGGHCKSVRVIDGAEGMSFNALKESITFSGDTSGFKEGRTVRGFFGRGLKESIIALGKGKIFTLNKGVLSKAEIFYDEEKKDASYTLATPYKGASEEELKKLGFFSNSGTIVEIEITNEKKSSIPSSKNIDTYISSHYSLRDVCSSNNREIRLYFSEPHNKGLISTDILLYSYPQGKLVYNKEAKLNGDVAHFRIYESDEQLTTPSKPQGTAGLLIKTEGAILDNKLFGYETDPAGLYFYGEIICPGIAKSIRGGDESIVDFNRGGLDWRHEHNKKLENLSKKILKQLVESKRNKIMSEKRQHVKQPIQKMLDRLCKEMSKLAKEELEEPGPAPGQLNSLIILPMVANISPGEPRQLGVYAPKYLTEDEGTKLVRLTSTNNDIKLINSDVKLDYYKKDESIFRTSFKVVGHTEGKTGMITAKLGKQTATCELRVSKLKKKGSPKRKRKTGGIFNKIIPAHDNDPIQRFKYDEGGIIKVFVKFPGVAKYLGDNFENIHTTEGKAILSEILLEAFCRHIAMTQAGKYFDEDIDHLVSEMDRLRRKASIIIYELVFKSDLSELIEKETNRTKLTP